VLARVIRDHVIPRPDLNGLYHVAAAPLNKYDLLQLVAKVYRKDIEIVPDERLVIDRSLDATRFREATGYQAPRWEDMIQAMYEFQ
jgi:dTDP-4-dehydrorhamnose reductase